MENFSESARASEKSRRLPRRPSPSRFPRSLAADARPAEGKSARPRGKSPTGVQRRTVSSRKWSGGAV
eukprot:232862-Pyramimonas_sp.AAC.1